VTGAPAESAALRCPRVLVVDDEPDLLQIVVEILARAGYEVTCARSGEDAVRCLTSGRFHLVLTDYKMPGMDGLQMLAALEELDPSLHAHAVVMTGYASDDVRAALRQSGLPYLAKPFSSKQLLLALEHACS
jgi:CheY-like chemotaxis protein